MRGVIDSLVGLGRRAEAIPLIDEYLAKAAGKVFDPDILGLIERRLRYSQEAADPGGCRATAAIWERLNQPGGFSLYAAACFRAVSAGVYAGKGQPAEAAADADRAMDWLRKAVAAGYRNRAQMDADADLDPLRGRPDFRALLATLPYTAPPPRPAKR